MDGKNRMSCENFWLRIGMIFSHEKHDLCADVKKYIAFIRSFNILVHL